MSLHVRLWVTPPTILCGGEGRLRSQTTRLPVDSFDDNPRTHREKDPGEWNKRLLTKATQRRFYHYLTAMTPNQVAGYGPSFSCPLSRSFWPFVFRIQNPFLNLYPIFFRDILFHFLFPWLPYPTPLYLHSVGGRRFRSLTDVLRRRGIEDVKHRNIC